MVCLTWSNFCFPDLLIPCIFDLKILYGKLNFSTSRPFFFKLLLHNIHNKTFFCCCQLHPWIPCISVSGHLGIFKIFKNKWWWFLWPFSKIVRFCILLVAIWINPWNKINGFIVIKAYDKWHKRRPQGNKL